MSEATLGGLAVATMFRGDPHQLVQWCNFHLSCGAERLYVVLDDPRPELVDSLPSDPRLDVEVVDRATWSTFYAPGSDNVERRQVDAFRRAAARAEADGLRHLAFVDTDELLDLAVPFSEIAAAHPDAHALTVPVREMWYAEGDPITEPFGATLSLGRSSRGVPWGDIIGWRAQYLRNGLLGHDSGKTIYRLPLTSGPISVHGPLTGALRGRTVALTEQSARLLHFDSGNLATWNTKWASRLQGAVVATGLGLHRKAQLALFAHELRRSPHEQERFFRGFYSLGPDAVAALEERGLVLRRDVSDLIQQPFAVPAPTGADALVQLPEAGRRVDYQFAMVCDRNFVSPTYATLLSVLHQIDESSSVRIVILGDRLGRAASEHFKTLEALPHDVEVRVVDVTDDLDRDLGRWGHGRSRATYGRVYLVDHLPEQRTLYLDGDVLATRDITELFALDLEGACIAGVTDSAALRTLADPDGVPLEQRMRQAGITADQPLEYLNAGVLLLDLDNPGFRERALWSRQHVALMGRALAQHDQDAINLAFRGSKHHLPSSYNYMTQFYTSERAVDGDLVALKYAAADASLIHFSGKIKPWVAYEDEFYNALYRRIVLAAEDRFGVSCGFWFSRAPQHTPQEWTTEKWTSWFSVPALPGPREPRGAEAHRRATTGRSAPGGVPLDSDVELVGITDGGVYLRVTGPAYEHALAAGLGLIARVGDDVAFEVPLDRFGAQRADLREKVAPAVRVAPLDLAEALRPYGGVARHVRLTLGASGTSFERPLGSLDVLAAGPAASADLLGELGVDGAVDGLDGPWLTGWYSTAGEVAVALQIGAELVVRRLSPRPEDGGARRFRFHVSGLTSDGYGAAGGQITVRVAGTNVPLPGTALSVEALRRALAEHEEPEARGDATRARIVARGRRAAALARDRARSWRQRRTADDQTSLTMGSPSTDQEELR